MDSSISGVKMYKCKMSEIRARVSCSILEIESCDQVNIYLNNKTLNTKISTTNTASTIIHFPAKGITDEQLENRENEDSYWIIKPIPEVYTTSIVEADRSMVTEGYMDID